MTTHKIMMRNMRTILLAALLLAGVTAGAVKMKPGLTAVVQSDGTTLLVEAFGDEDFSYFVSEDGVLLCRGNGLLHSRNRTRRNAQSYRPARPFAQDAD